MFITFKYVDREDDVDGRSDNKPCPWMNCCQQKYMWTNQMPYASIYEWPWPWAVVVKENENNLIKSAVSQAQTDPRFT